MSDPKKIKKDLNWKAAAIFLLAAYTLIILLETLLRKPFEGKHLGLTLFWSYRVIDRQFKQMFLNVLLFVPFGVLMSLLDKRVWRIVLAGFALSCTIELLQYVFKLGLCELDDVFHNTLGTLIGLYIGNWITKKVNAGNG